MARSQTRNREFIIVESKTQKQLRDFLYTHMKKNNLGFVNINASMNAFKSKVIMGVTEEEEPDPLDELIN